jgi:hypothetical protein
MYLSIIILPLLGSIVSGFFGRKIGDRGAQFITTLCVIITTILAVIAFFEVGFNNVPISVGLFRWIDSQVYLNWGFNFDGLSVAMLIPVLTISSLVHLFSISYMHSDPHNPRFFSYLSLFTFMMIILVTSENYLMMFVGLFSAVYVCKLINYYSTDCWESLAYVLGLSAGNPFVIRRSSETKRGISHYIRIKTGCKDKVIVLGFMWIKLLLRGGGRWNLPPLLDLFCVYSYYLIYYIAYPICIFKRPYSITPEQSKFSNRYKKEYELTLEQREAIQSLEPRKKWR